MIRSLLRLGGAIAFAALLAPTSSTVAAPAPGLAYDEIVRAVVGATPPPPGNFAADVAAITSSPATAAATPAPRKRGLSLGAIAGALAGGGLGGAAGSVAGDAMSNAMEGAMEKQFGAAFGGLADAMRSFLQPRVFHYAYWNGWERVDDVADQTATIRKCDRQQVIKLDLKNKTYAIYDPTAEPSPAPRNAAPAPRSRGARSSEPPSAPGTAQLDLTLATSALPPVAMERQSVRGFQSDTTLAITNATGSCRDGSVAVRTVEFLAANARPSAVSCPVRRAPVPQTAADLAPVPTSEGGCRPTFAVHHSGPTPPTGRLALYSLVSFSGRGASPAPAASPAAAPGSLAFLTERGNLTTLSAADAATFEIPAGFTKAP